MNTTRQQMIQTAARLFQRDGYHATTWRSLVKEAGAPWGSINHHFPSGKQQLAIETIQFGAAAVEAAIDHCFSRHDDPAESVAAWFDLSTELMVTSDYATGCPVATVALELVAQPGPLRDETRRAFSAWEAALTRHLTDAGHPDPADTALTVLALLEGALLLARTHHDTRAMSIARDQVRRLLTDQGT
jgi:TetR/AcrR family transcriptional repressor of lmrAB and yxaGH operons